MEGETAEVFYSLNRKHRNKVRDGGTCYLEPALIAALW